MADSKRMVRLNYLLYTGKATGMFVGRNAARFGAQTKAVHLGLLADYYACGRRCKVRESPIDFLWSR